MQAGGMREEESWAMDKVNFLLVGVGGQGTLLAANILAEVGLLAGYDVKKSEIHGMAQRGGSVSSHVRWGPVVHSPVTGKGEVDVLLGLEKMEAMRYIDFLRPGGKAVLSTHMVFPVSVTSGGMEYPSDERFTSVIGGVTKDYYLVPAVKMAQELGNARVHNVILLGALASIIKVDLPLWMEAITRNVPEKALHLNHQAFSLGLGFLADRKTG